ncbi:hypothetical protein PRNP1_004898 [Phytophthora ramorum]
MERFSSGGGSFRGGRGRGGFGRGRGGRGGRGRGRGRGGGRGGRGNFQQRRHDDAGYTEGYAPPQAPYPQQFGDFGQGYPPPQQGYAPPPPPQQGYAPPPQQFPPQQEQFQSQYQQYPPPPQDQYQPPQYQQQGYADDSRGGYNGNPPPVADRYQPMDNFQNQPPPSAYQQYQQLPPQQYQPPPPQQQFQQFQDESPRYAATPPLPPQPPVDYADAARARQQAYAPIQSEDNTPEDPLPPYQQSSQPPPPSYQQQPPPPLPPTPQSQRGDWNYVPPPQEQQWEQQLQQPQFGGPPPAYSPQGTNTGPPMDQQRHFQRDQNPRFQDRRQDRHDRQQHKPHRPPPPTYVCHNCNQPGHWKQHCPLFANENENRAGPRQDDQFPQRYGPGPGPDRQWGSAPPAPGIKPQDPRRNGGSYHIVSPEDVEDSGLAMKNEPRGQPPLPGGPAPPLPPDSQPPLPYGNDGYAQQQSQSQPQPGQQVWKCDTCVKSFVIVSQYEAHIGTHETCSDCDFSASKRVVTAHYQTAHGQYAGQGLKEIDVEGQKFMVLVGNSVEDITKWREERRKRWLAMSSQPKPPAATPAPVAGKRKLSVSSEEDLEEGEIEEDEEAKAQIALKTAARKLATSDAGASETSGTGTHEPPAKKQRKTMLCKWFSRGHCRFDEGHCKYSHDRSAFGCRAMMYKGSCSKGMYCPFSHDTAVLSGQRERSQKASKERATEQQWRGEQKSLLRKLLAKDVRVEQLKMLQIVHFLVANDFLRSPDGEKADESTQESAMKIEVLKSAEPSTSATAEASEPIESVSEDIVMEEASDEMEQVSTGEAQGAVPPQAMEADKVVAGNGNVVPVVEATACGQESQGVSESPITEETEVVAPSRDDESEVVVEASQGETMKDASSSAQDPQCHAEGAITEEVVVAVPSKDMELAQSVAPASGEEPAKDVPSGQASTLEASAGETNGES